MKFNKNLQNKIKSVTGFPNGFNFRKILYFEKEVLSKNLFELNRLRKKIKEENLIKIKKSKSYKGIRHRLFLPVRGQRTHTNSKTRRK